jgi:dTDP-4-amino-4,6-dideoxygalactose transaminase
MLIPHSRPLITAETIGDVEEVLRTGYIAQGEKVLEFERTCQDM